MTAPDSTSAVNRRPIFAAGRTIAALLCLFVYALFLVTWIRSYWWQDAISMQIAILTRMEITSRNGQISASVAHTDATNGVFQLRSYRITAVRIPLPRFGMQSNYTGHFELELPHWFIALLFATVTPLMRREFPYLFSLRTLFIVTTVISMLLGAVAAAL